MTLKSLQPRRWTAVALCLLWGTTAVTAQVSGQPRGAYQRVNFTFDKPARLTVDTTDHSIVLHFDTPLDESPAQVTAALKGYATGASLSPDGKTLTIATAKRYRTRHFVSGTTVGLDVIGAPPGERAANEVIAAPDEPNDEMLTTRKPDLAPIPAMPAPVKKPAGKPGAKTQLAAKPAGVAPPEKPNAAAPPRATGPSREAMLSTKPAKAEPAQKTPEEPSATVSSVPAKPSNTAEAAAKALPRTVEKPASPAEKPVSAPSQETSAGALAAPDAPEGKMPPADSTAVTARGTPAGTVLHFPYRERTAAAVFERGNTLWLVFSHPMEVDTAQLKKHLPKNASSLRQFAFPNHMVLQVKAKGNLHASVKTDSGNYGWDVMLTDKPIPPPHDISMKVDASGEVPSLVLGAFDIAEPVKFYDPDAGDLLVVLPSFESGAGIANARNFPEFGLLASAQGIAITSTRSDLSFLPSRVGVTLTAPKGLAISNDLGLLGADATPVAGLTSGVMLPYEQWHVTPDAFYATLMERQNALTHSTKDDRADHLLALATLYLGQGLGAEALGYLDLLNANEPEFYKARKLAMLTVAAHALMHHPDLAAEAIGAPELANEPEAQLWREYLMMLAPKASIVQLLQGAGPAAINLAEDTDAPKDGITPADPFRPTQPLMRYLKYNTPYIRFYPPKIRQMLASAAADAYIANGLQEKAITTFDTLTRDGILDPIRRRAEYAVAMVALKTKKFDQAVTVLKRLEMQHDDTEMQARARVAHAMLLMSQGKKTPAETADTLESARLTWRGDALERDALKQLAEIYKNEKRYDDALRTYKTLNDAFPDDPDYLANSTAMTELFEQLYVKGLADELPPLTSLSLFYEFRDLTPIGEKGDLIIQKLADRLAAFDLIDRATQLLENQISFRVGGEDRSRIGARLALLYLLNHQPEEALKTIEVTNFGGNAPELQRQRMQLAAQALMGLKRYDEALNMLYYDNTPDGDVLKLDILWAAGDWPNVINKAEDVLSKRTDLTAALSPTETDVLLKLALGYSFEGDYTQLRYLRDYYSALMPDSGYKQIFDFITNDTAPLDREDTAMLSEQISHTEGFLNAFKAKIAAGKLSEAIK